MWRPASATPPPERVWLVASGAAKSLTGTLGVLLAGSDVPLVPRKTLALRADWTPVARHRVSAGVNWVSLQHPDFGNACTIPSYTTMDARYAYEWKQLELSLGVTNLADRKYYTQAFGCATNVTTSIYPEAGRAFTAAVRVKF